VSDGDTTPDSLARDLSRAGYERLFYAGEAGSVWRGGENAAALEAIVRDERQGDLPRLLAAEVLRRERAASAPEELAPIYARALALSGVGDGPFELPANEWGFMYEDAGDPHGALGARLLDAGSAAVRHLAGLLDDARPLLYVGSKEATVGNDLGYRVKDAAAYYLGAITGKAVPFHEDLDARDEEIERLRAGLALS
jgi:hypothetical protein